MCAIVCLLFAHSRSSAERIRLLASSPKVRSQPCLASSACISFQLSNLPVFARETARRYISSRRLPIVCPLSNPLPGCGRRRNDVDEPRRRTPKKSGECSKSAGQFNANLVGNADRADARVSRSPGAGSRGRRSEKPGAQIEAVACHAEERGQYETAKQSDGLEGKCLGPGSGSVSTREGIHKQPPNVSIKITILRYRNLCAAGLT